MKLHYCFNIES